MRFSMNSPHQSPCTVMRRAPVLNQSVWHAQPSLALHDTALQDSDFYHLVIENFIPNESRNYRRLVPVMSFIHRLKATA